VNLVRFSIGFREKSMKMSFLEEFLWILDGILEQKVRTRMKKVKIDDF